MQRSDAVTVILARIMKMMDRSNESVLRGFAQFESSDKIVEASINPLRRQLRARGRNAQPNRVLSRQKLRYPNSDNFAPAVHTDPLASQLNAYELGT
jgi:hypothetical protein